MGAIDKGTKDPSLHYKCKDLKVAIFAQLLPGRAGGIEMNLLSLLKVLNHLDDSGCQVIIGPGDDSKWLEPHIGSKQSILPWPPMEFGTMNRPHWFSPQLWELGRRGLGRYRVKVVSMIHKLIGSAELPHITEGGEISRVLIDMGVQLIHFPYQRFFPTPLPLIFEPWDLQHRHYPEFFTQEEIRKRDKIYQEGCQHATLIVTASEWSKKDVVRQFGVDPKKIAVIPRAPIISGKRRLNREEAAFHLQSLRLPNRFILYPAKAWPHKNHLRLFQALAQLTSQYGLSVPLVCTGMPVEEYFPFVKKGINEMRLEKSVIFTGYLNDKQMSSLYSISEFLIFPSLFEGLGIPLLEAMHFGLPIVTSNLTCLPEVAGDAALYFDPLSVDSIAEAIKEAWSKPSILEEYRKKGFDRIKRFSWDGVGRQFQSCYRYVGSRNLSLEDQETIKKITCSEMK